MRLNPIPWLSGVADRAKRETPTIDWSGTRWASDEPPDLPPIVAPDDAPTIDVKLYLPADDNAIHPADYRRCAAVAASYIRGTFHGFWPVSVATHTGERVPLDVYDSNRAHPDFIEWAKTRDPAWDANVLLAPTSGAWGYDNETTPSYAKSGSAWRMGELEPGTFRDQALHEDGYAGAFTLLHELLHCLDVDHNDGGRVDGYMSPQGYDYGEVYFDGISFNLHRNERRLIKQYMLTAGREDPAYQDSDT